MCAIGQHRGSAAATGAPDAGFADDGVQGAWRLGPGRGGAAMLRLAGVALVVGLADSLNPSTVGPALYLATARRPVARVALFTIGVFAVNLAGGILLATGPGRLLIGVLPRPDRTVRHAIELSAGIALTALAAALWLGRRRLARRELPMRGGGGGSALIGGASIAAVELPTAAPYFAVIAGLVAARPSVPQTIAILAVFCAAFIAPLVAIIVVLLIAGERADPLLQKGGGWLQRHWPVVLAAVLLLVGVGLTVNGATGLLRA
jgi:cytochrome c biogenesis protein CcdA